MPSPSPHPTNNVGWVYPEWVGEERTTRKFEKDALYYEGTQKLQKIMNTALLPQGLLSMIVGSGKIGKNSFN